MRQCRVEIQPLVNARQLLREPQRFGLVRDPLLQQVLRLGPLAAANECVQIHLVEQIALRMAAADLDEARQGQTQAFDGGHE
ncbi:MAG: hypothetical protein JWP52_327, partial [Rhizobacter sp.]|nr:hypothetical protein [Rhizobacter sp.]